MDHYADGVEVPPCSTAQLRKLASQIRSAIGLADDKAFPVGRFIEYVLPEVYEDFTLEIVPIGQLGEKHGETFPNKHLMRLREDVYIGICMGNGQHRFTGAHECSHLIYHEGVPLAMARRSAKRLPRFRNSEWQADTLAAELLMPYKAVKRMDTRDIERQYGVSPSAALCRREKIDKEMMQYRYLKI